MGLSLSGRSYLKLLDFTTDEIRYLLDLSRNFKDMKRTGVPHKFLEGKNIVLLFEKTSTRTRCAFEVAAMDLGMGVTFLDPGSAQMGTKESIQDTAKVLGRMYDGIEYRGFSQKIVEELAEHSGVPVWNGLTDDFHPTQMLADMLTIEENFGHLEEIKLVYMGDARNNVANSLMIACAKLGLNFTACSPPDLFPVESLVKKAEELSIASGSEITLEADVQKGTRGAHVIYTDVWVSMGEPDDIWESRIAQLKPYQVNMEAMKNASKGAIFLHCLPSFHDLGTSIGMEIYHKFGLSEIEVTDDVFKSERSKVFDQAENRVHSIKAIMYATLK